MGGIVVSDPNNPSFQGQILFGDLPRGTLMHANYHSTLIAEQHGKQIIPSLLTLQLGEKTGSMTDILGTERGDVRFGVDQNNAVYFVSKRATRSSRRN